MGDARVSADDLQELRFLAIFGVGIRSAVGASQISFSGSGAKLANCRGSTSHVA